MERITLGNRPESLQPRTRIEDFSHNGVNARVSLKLVEAGGDKLLIDAQAFEVDSNGSYKFAPDGRPSRTPGTSHMVMASSLGDTHTLNPGWIRIVGDYDAGTFESTAARGEGRPVSEPEWATNPTGQYYDNTSGVGYRWDEGEVLRIAKGKVTELMNIVANSGSISGIEF